MVHIYSLNKNTSVDTAFKTIKNMKSGRKLKHTQNYFKKENIFA